MKRNYLLLIILSLLVNLISKAQTGNYEAIHLNRTAWPYLLFQENGTNVARIQGSGGLFRITSTDGGTTHFSLNPTNGDIDIGTLRLSSSRVKSTASNLHLDAGTGFTYLNYYDGEGVYFGGGDAATRVGTWLKNGNVGIGTLNPRQLLHISNSSGEAGAELVGGASGNAFIRLEESGYTGFEIKYDGVENKLLFGGGNDGNYTPKMTINRDNGNVGIGTSTPTFRLDIQGPGTDGGIHLKKTDGVTASWYLHPGRLGDGEFTIGDDSQYRFTILPNGNIGIGTTSPRQKLDVDGQLILGARTNEINKAGYIISSQYSTTNEPEGFYVIGGWASDVNNVVSIGGSSSSYNASNLIRFYTASNTTSRTGAERMRIEANGNVGIGTDTPDNLLQLLQSSNYDPMSHITPALRIKSNGANAIGNYHGTLALSRGTGHVAISAVQEDSDVDVMGIAFFTHPSATGTDAAVERMRIDKDGNVGIGTTTPVEKLHVSEGNIIVDNGYYLRGLRTDGSVANICGVTQGSNQLRLGSGGWSSITFDVAGAASRMYINENGNVGIGTTETGPHKLVVEGSIGAREIKVQTTGWADFVFENNYELKEIEEVESFIKENKHLPDIPPAKEIEENGVNLGEMDAKLLQKIEELTLYLIDQNKKMEQMQERINELEGRIDQ